MRVHEVDLLSCLPALRTWSELSPPTRLAFLEAAGNRTTPAGHYGDDEPAMLQAGLLDATPRGLRRVGSEAGALRVLLRAAARCRVLSSSSTPEEAIEEYVEECYRRDERAALLASPIWSGRSATLELARRVASRRWVVELTTSKPAAWEGARRQGGFSTEAVWDDLLTPMVHAELGRLLQDAAAAGGTLTLPEFLEGGSPRQQRTRASALRAGLRYLALFPSLDPDDPVLVVGPTPAAAEAFGRHALPRPEPVDVPVDVVHAFLIDDMVAVLLDVAGGDARVKANRLELYRRTDDRMKSALPPLSPALARWIEVDESRRLEGALIMLSTLELMVVEKRPNGRRFLRMTEAGQTWLAGSAADRLATVGRHVRGDRAMEHDENPWVRLPAVQTLAPHVVLHRRELDGVPDEELADALRCALAEIPTRGSVSLRPWLQHQAREENPLTGTGPAGHGFRPATRIGRWITPESLEDCWSSLLVSAITTRLLPLGGLGLSDGADGPLLRLTSVGRFLLHRQETFDLPGANDREGRIVVQPSFDVVFLAPSPEHEALLAPLAERVGHGVGTLFHLSRDAATRAAAAGMTSEEAIDRLRRASTEDVPENVVRSVRGWFERIRTVDATHRLVLGCPDEETAARVATAGGAEADRLGPLHVAVSDERALRSIRTKLAREGILLEAPKHDGRNATQRRPRRRRRR